MNDEILIREIREVCRIPEPAGKTDFFADLKRQGITGRRSFSTGWGEFLTGQLSYIGKWTWVLSAAVLVFIVLISSRRAGEYPFALTPLLAAGILIETKRSARWKMAELEQAARFSLKSIMFARMFLIGAADTAGLILVIFLVRPYYSYSLIRVFLYMMVPFLSAAWLGTVYERQNRNDSCTGSIMICILSSAVWAVLTAAGAGIYEKSLTGIWAAALIITVVNYGRDAGKWMIGAGEMLWN